MTDPIPWQNIRAILFDMDGTLIDTDDQAVAKLERRLRPLLRDRAHQVARWIMMKSETPGNWLITLLDWLHLDEPLMGFTDKLRQRRGVADEHHFQLIDGVAEMLPQLAQTYQIGLVTTRSRYHIEALFRVFPEFASLFSVTCGLQDTRRLKPHPEPVEFAAAQLGVPVDQCVMVGDTTVDVLSARRAGAWSIAVLCGFGERSELEHANAHLILDSTAEISSQ